MRSIVFEGDTWGRYEALRFQDKQLHRNLCRLIQEMQRGDPAVGAGKPEPLEHGLSGLWSRRLSQKDRLIYRFDDSAIYIFAIGDTTTTDKIGKETPSSCLSARVSSCPVPNPALPYRGRCKARLGPVAMWPSLA